MPPETQPQAPEVPRFNVKPTEPDEGFDGLGLLLVAGGTLAAAVLAGLVVHLTDFRIVGITAALMGVVIGLAGAGLARVGKVRNADLADIVAVAGALAALVSLHLFDAWQAGLGLFESLKAQAVAGITFSRFGSPVMHLGLVGSYIYWLVEVVICAAVALPLMKRWLGAPFCVACGRWKQARRLGSVEATQETIEAVDRGEVVGLLRRRLPPVGRLWLLEAHVCPRCFGKGDVEISLMEVRLDERGKQETVVVRRVTYPGAVWQPLVLTAVVAAVNPPA
jgi:hypothetical protein